MNSLLGRGFTLNIKPYCLRKIKVKQELSSDSIHVAHLNLRLLIMNTKNVVLTFRSIKMILLSSNTLEQFGCNFSSRNCETINTQLVALTLRTMSDVGLVL